MFYSICNKIHYLTIMKYGFGLYILVFFASSCGEQSSSSFDEDGSRNGGWECFSGDCENGIGIHVDSSFTQDYFEIRKCNVSGNLSPTCKPNKGFSFES